MMPARSTHIKIGLALFAVSLLSVLAASQPAPQDWPMWGGTPERNMVSPTKNLPEAWDAKSGQNVKWKVQIGTTSHGNPVVADGKIFLGTNNGNPRNPEIVGDKGVLMCLRESDGKVYLGDDDGDVAVLKAGAEMKKIAEIDMGNPVDSTPVPANGVLYIMTASELYAIAAGAEGPGK